MLAFVMAQNTKTRLLDAAERLFGENGLDATSIRDVTKRAGANVASVSFHFGSKEGLIREVFLRRLKPLTEKRLENLGKLQHAPTPPTADALLQAFLAPLIDMSESPARGTQAFLRLFARTLVDPAPVIEDIFARELGDYTQTYFSAFAKTITHISRDELADRLDFMVGAIGHALSDTARQRLASRISQTDTSQDGDKRLARLTHFALAGLTAPPLEPLAA